ncbi:MAG: molybdopterin biosynthesis protein [Dehalococcoidales bacterium]|nr:molybdopterin biosynthesis protein [Dehalococcoidales bacterium]
MADSTPRDQAAAAGPGRRKLYLEDIPLDEALRRLWAALAEAGFAPLPAEQVALDDALGRVTAEAVWARNSVPHYNAAAMDGIVVRSRETHGATETAPLTMEAGRQALWVDTGDPLPEGYDAVIMAEEVQVLDEERLAIRAAAAPWQHVRAIGEDVVAGELVLPENHLLGPADIGAVAAAGHTVLSVRRRPRVAIVPTGDELVAPGEQLHSGDIVEFNSLILAGMVRQWGGEATRWPIVRDELPLIKEAVAEALATHDVVLVNAGSSAGSEDYTSTVISSLGELLVHGVAIRPGHPLALGVAQGKALVGIPGYPVSAALTCELFVRPVVHGLLGLVVPERPRTKATMTRKVLSPTGLDEYMRVKVGKVGERMVATPLPRGAGVIMSLVRADGIVRIPRFSEGIHMGAETEVELLRPPEEVERTIVAIGSHDLTLDLLASHLRRRRPDLSLSSANVGSLGGLMALRRNEAHLAGSHLLDPDSGEYNVADIKRLLPDRSIVLVNLVYREQVLFVLPGNPKGIHGLEDLVRDDVVFVNRQREAGTRVLLDYKLKQRGLDPGRVTGYERVEYTHLAVAAAVAGGTADVGLGVLAAARALGLDSIPVAKERYDLVIPREYYESEAMQALLKVVRGDEFKRAVEALGGYDVSQTGQVMAEIGPTGPGTGGD